MIKIILLLTTALFFTALIKMNNTVGSFKVDNNIGDTLPIIDTIGQGNWQHSLRNDSLKILKSRDSSIQKNKGDSLNNNIQQ